MKISLTDLRREICSALAKIGFTDPVEAGIIADCLIYAETHDQPDQGIGKLLTKFLRPHQQAREVSIQRVAGALAAIDGGQRSAPFVMWEACKEGMTMAMTYGCGTALIRNISSSSGCLGFFAGFVASCGYQGQVVATTFPKMSPAGGSSAALGINTIAWGFPGPDSSPVVIDLTTAAMPLMQIMAKKQSGKGLPPGVAYDESGQATASANAALNPLATLRPFGDAVSHKAAVLATALQISAQVVPGAAGDSADWGARVEVTAIPDKTNYFQLLAALDSRITNSKPARDKGRCGCREAGGRLWPNAAQTANKWT